MNRPHKAHRAGYLIAGSLIVLMISGCTSYAPIPVATTPTAMIGATPSNAGEVPIPTSTYSFHPVDSGTRDGASGKVTLDADGEPFAYIVADGDVLINISFRFGVDVTELTTSAGSRYDYDNSPIIQPSDEIRFKGTRG